MIRNVDGTYIYLVVPAKYECVYTKLLVKMTDLGIDLLKDCASTCRGVNRQVLNCWNMFQAACTAYELGEVKKADLLINYINASLNFACTSEQAPTISNFKLNIANTVEGGKSYNITQATFSITNVSSAKANSLKIIEMDKDGEDYTIVSNLPLTSPANFSAYSLAAIAGSTYRFQCAIQDENDNWVYSGMYTVVATAPVERNTMYYGHTTVNGSEGALAFKNKKATELMVMPHEDKEIVGNSEVTFVIHQEQNVHWLLIPTEKLELIHAEYGTVLITTLWDKEQNRGAYKQPFDAGEYNGVAYTMFFLYSPGTFDDDIRITVKKSK